MSAPPVTEEDKPAVESMVLRIKRLRKREQEHSKDCNGKAYSQPYLDEAIDRLMEYGAIKGWWEYDNY